MVPGHAGLILGESYSHYPDVNAQRIGTAFTIHQVLSIGNKAS